MSGILMTGLLLQTFSSCTVSKFSNKTKEEDLAVTITEDEQYLASANSESPLGRGPRGRGVITVAMIAKVASIGAEAVKKVIDKEKKKYTAEYSEGLSGLYFYSHLSEKNAWDPEGIQLRDFTLLRTFENKSGKTDTAIMITFTIDTSRSYEIYNNAVFRLKVKDIMIRYARAKVPTQRWYFPWTYLQKKKNDKLDMDVEIEFTTSYNTEQGNFNHNMSLGKCWLFVRDAPLRKQDPGYNRYYDSLAGVQLDGYSFIVPRSYGHYFNGSEFMPCYSQGNYNITIRVSESGQSKFVDKLIMDNSGAAIDALVKQANKLK